ncbi:Eco57I restriction-modification methylase domain-containing protein [Prescottella equi]|uniref:Eco57I restriction-modification methylase domain-containing protein n=1 Tax=Rhodococcus hoagii TaxID=43767 RepID=UPI0007CD7781|nr:DNA methyltransferase [Prescottella equi]
MARQTRRTPTTNAADLHRGWLELVDTEGPFLAIPPLKRVWPNGIPDFRKTHPSRFDVLTDARKWFESAWEALDRSPDSETALDSYRAARDEWIQTVLRDVAGWSESLSWGDVPGVQAQSPNRAVAVTAQAALCGADGIGALVHVVDPVDSLRQTPSDLWAATPVDRLEELLRKSKCDIGVVTDGRWWGLVYASEGSMAASGIVDALTWTEEPRTRDAFLTLLGRQHIIGGDLSERLPVLFEESVAAAEEITEALGAQVRRAVELLIQSFSESAADARRRGLPDPLPARTHDTYEAAVTVMMRVVFLLFAEERGLLPTGELFEQGYGISRELARLAARESGESEEALDSTSLTWHRLLATSAALYSGATFENMRMPAYGGSLFDPARFPFLADANEQGSLAITVSDRVMLHVLRSVQIADIKGEARRISFRDIDVEQIGYIYEGLLGYTAAVAGDVVVGLKGKLGEEPEIPLAVLEALAAEHTDPKKLAAAIRSFAGEDQPSATPQSAAAIAKAIDAEVEPGVVSALTQAVGDDLDLRDRVKPWLGLIRLDLRKHPFVVLAGGLLVKETPSRKNAGAHYTPKSLAEEVVLHALQPLCYSPGPNQTAEEAAWKLKSSDELLDLKVVDIACGSGAFLVAAARYLADRVVEAWVREDEANAHRKDLQLLAMREVVADCIYGADINGMAVEMCKLSLWLVSLDKSKPFSFVDDKVFCGNSLLGVTSLNQLRRLHVYPDRKPRYLQPYIDVDGILAEAARLRRELASPVDEDNPQRSTVAKKRLLLRIEEVTAKLRLLADGIIAVGLALGGKPGNRLDDAYKLLEGRAGEAFPEDGSEGNLSKFEAIIEDGLAPQAATDFDRWKPLHWAIEVPDVMALGGFSAVVGNPPFIAGTDVPGALGGNFHDWVANSIGEGVKGKADIVAFFILRAVGLIDPSGSFGLIATNTVAQGDTREVGLDVLVRRGSTLTRAVRSARWPSVNATVEYAAIWGTQGALNPDVKVVVDGIHVKAMSTLLEPVSNPGGLPQRLVENRNFAFNGMKIYGTGFVVTEEEAREWICGNANNRDVLFPCVAGEDLYKRPDASAAKWAIDFNNRTLEDAARYVEPFARVVEAVKPERDRVNRKAIREKWWHYGDKRPALRAALAHLDHCLVIVTHSKIAMPVSVAARQVLNHSLTVFATDDLADLAILSSTPHFLWAATYGSTLGHGIRYTPTDVFETLVRPATTDRLRVAGERLNADRRSIMIRRGIGMTDLYNMINKADITTDADIIRMREIHVEIDEAVMVAYGWDDVPLDHGFHTYRQMERWTVSPAARIEILDRLLEENHRRAAAEAAVNRGSLKGRKSKVVSEGQGTLL